MNVLVIVADTVRRDHLDCYGGTVGTPALSALASQSVVFDHAYSGSFPTLPCRAELFTGRITFPYLDWGPLPQSEVLLSEVFGRAHYRSALITDNLPLCRANYGYDRGFDSRVRIRGQWYDDHRPVERELPLPVEPRLIGEQKRVQQYLHNVAGRETEEEYFAPQTVHAACRWLEEQGSRTPFFLWVDLFDPHEPWDPPASDVPEAADGKLPWILYPRFGEADYYAPEHLEAIRALYRGEVRLMDRWVGRLLERLEELGLAEDTCVAFLSDHGMFLGEHNLLGKSSKIGGDLRGWPPYVEVARIPLMVRMPGVAPGRSEALCHPGDLTPTLLELAGVKRPDTMRTRSLVPNLRGEPRGREIAVSSWSLRGRRATRPSVVRDDEWSLVFWRTGMVPELYHRATDPGETRSVLRRHPAEARRLHRDYVRFLEENETPARNLWPRRWLVTWESDTAWQETTGRARAEAG